MLRVRPSSAVSRTSPCARLSRFFLHEKVQDALTWLEAVTQGEPDGTFILAAVLSLTIHLALKTCAQAQPLSADRLSNALSGCFPHLTVHTKQRASLSLCEKYTNGLFFVADASLGNNETRKRASSCLQCRASARPSVSERGSS